MSKTESVSDRKGNACCPLVIPYDSSLSTSPIDRYSLAVRVAYKFTVSQEQMTDILGAWNGVPETPFNVVEMAYMNSDKEEGELDVEIVIGYPNAENRQGGGNFPEFNPRATDGWQNCRFRQVLLDQHVCYTEAKIIQIFNALVPGVNSSLQNVAVVPLQALLEAGVKVLNYSNGEPSHILPLIPISCDPNNLVKFEPISLFIEPECKQVQRAVDVLSAMRFGLVRN